MARGLKLPLGVDRRGRGALIEKEEQDNKIIGLALSDLYNENAFQQEIGLDTGFIFDKPDSTFRAFVRHRIIQAFDRFEALELYKLIRQSLVFEAGTAGQQTVKFKYINLESDEEQSFSRNLITAG